MESKEQYVANYLIKMSKYPEYVKKSLVFYRKEYGDLFAEMLIKLMSKANKK